MVLTTAATSGVERVVDGGGHLRVQRRSGAGPQLGLVQQQAAGERCANAARSCGLLARRRCRPRQQAAPADLGDGRQRGEHADARPAAGVSSSQAPARSTTRPVRSRQPCSCRPCTSSSTRRPSSRIGRTTRSSTSSTRSSAPGCGSAAVAAASRSANCSSWRARRASTARCSSPVRLGHLRVGVAGEDVQPGPVDPAVLAHLAVQRVEQGRGRGRRGEPAQQSYGHPGRLDPPRVR